MNIPIKSALAPADLEERARHLRQMKRFATGLFLLMTLVYTVCLFAEPQVPWLGYMKAFAEAAMVGALADWFAVTALFRHPLGIPVPHTAIIATNKDRIGKSLGNFVENNFLTAEILRTKLESLNVLDKLSGWIAQPENSGMLADKIVNLIPAALETFNHEEVQQFLEHNLSERMRSIKIAPLAGNVLAALTVNNRHQGLLNEALSLAANVIEENKDLIRTKIRDESPWFVPGFVDDKIYEKILQRTQETLREMKYNPEHELRRKFHQATQEFIHNLRTSPEYADRAEQMKEEFLQHPVVQQYTSSLWVDIKNRLLADVEKPDSVIRAHLQNIFQRMGATLQQDEGMRQKANEWLHTTFMGIVESRKHDIAALIAETVERWDGKTMSERIELQVGRDLQFIRINGTLVGGLVGLLIYIISGIVRGA